MIEQFYEWNRIKERDAAIGFSAKTRYGVKQSGVWMFPADFEHVRADRNGLEPGVPVDLWEIDSLIHETRHDPTLLGNRVEAWAQKVGADKAAELWERWTKLPCGCPWRKAFLNGVHGSIRRWLGGGDAK